VAALKVIVMHMAQPKQLLLRIKNKGRKCL
jgi:hypothetical protein